MATKSMILIQSGPDNVFIRDTDGLEITFQSFEDYSFYTGATEVPAGSNISYEPQKDLYFINGVRTPLPNAEYETQISSVAVYLQRQEDPLWGLEGEELFNAQNTVDLEEAENIYTTTCEAPVVVDTITYKGGEESASGINGAVTIAQNLGETSVFISDINYVTREMTFADATNVATQVAKVTRDAYLVRSDTIVEINERVYTP